MLDIYKIRDQFPALNQVLHIDQKEIKPIFFDGPGGSQLPKKVINSIVDYLSSGNANLGSTYFSSIKTDRVMKEARLAAANLYNAVSENEIIFGANASTLAFTMSRSIANTWEKGDEIIVTALDHYSNVSPWEIAAKEKGVIVHQCPVVEDDCSLHTDALLNLVNEKTRLIAVTYASNTTGSIVNLSDLIKEIKKISKALIYVDAVHLIPHQIVDVQALDCDFLVSSAYKYFGPHLGVLFAKREHQESLTPYKVEPAKNINPNRWETGTQSFEALSGLTAAIDYLACLVPHEEKLSRRKQLESSYKQLNIWEKNLSEYFLNHIKKFDNITLYGKQSIEGRTPTFAFRIKGISPNEITTFFSDQHICIGAGNFYAHGLYEQLGLTEKGGVIRVGLMHYNSKPEIDLFFNLLKAYISQHS